MNAQVTFAGVIAGLFILAAALLILAVVLDKVDDMRSRGGKR